MADQVGVQIGSHFYPLPTTFRLGDPVLVEELTGLTWADFVERLPDEDAPDDMPEDPVSMLGLIGVAVWQGNPTWRRDRVVRFVTALAMDKIEITGPEPEEATEKDDADGEGDGRPPESPSEPSSDSSQQPSKSDSESDSKESEIPAGSGGATSPT